MNVFMGFLHIGITVLCAQRWGRDPAEDGAGMCVFLDFLPIGITVPVYSSSGGAVIQRGTVQVQ